MLIKKPRKAQEVLNVALWQGIVGAKLTGQVLAERKLQPYESLGELGGPRSASRYEVGGVSLQVEVLLCAYSGEERREHRDL